MPDIPLRDVIDDLRSRLQTELEAELASLADSHDQALDAARRAADADVEAARRAAEADAERRWAARLETERADWTARFEGEVSAARAEAERQAIAEATRARMDAEQAAAEATATLRREMEQALTAERERAAAEKARLDAEYEGAERELADARAALAAERLRATEAVAAARQAAPALDTGRLLSTLSAIDAETSLTGVIRATIGAARAHAPRAALLIVNGAQLDEWTVPGAQPLSPIPMRVDGREAGFLAETLRRAEPAVSGVAGPLPTFANLPEGRRAIGVPFVFGGQPVAVLYADEGAQGTAAEGWLDAVQIIGRHASATAACITAHKTAEAMRLVHGGAAPPAASAGSTSDDIEQGARRYARLLVSEIKLYNEAAVRAGRQQRDLLKRLQPEIDRARRLYEERVSPAVSGRDRLFEQELVQTLADGDRSLLA